MQAEEAGLVVDYFHGADDAFLDLLGVDPSKLADPDEWRDLISRDLAKPLAKRKYYYLIWEFDGAPVGHSNIGDIVRGEHAYMHLHIWPQAQRQRGLGGEFVKRSVPIYFDKFDLETLYCQPKASNPAPNRTLAKVGFELLDTFETTPGWFNTYQTVNRWYFPRSGLTRLSNPAI